MERGLAAVLRRHTEDSSALAHVEPSPAHRSLPAFDELLLVRVADEERQLLVVIARRVEHELVAREATDARGEPRLLEHDHRKARGARGEARGESGGAGADD